jgi:hypothetical protein
MSGRQEHAVIALWRGYVSACFYARTLDVDTVLLVSPSFRTFVPPWRPRVPLDEDPAALDALAALEAAMTARGWRRSDSLAYAEWYELHFRRGPEPRARTPERAASRSRNGS